MKFIHWGKPFDAIPIFLNPEKLIDSKRVHTMQLNNIARVVSGDAYFPRSLAKSNALKQLVYAYKQHVAIVNEKSFSLIMSDSAVTSSPGHMMRKYVNIQYNTDTL